MSFDSSYICVRCSHTSLVDFDFLRNLSETAERLSREELLAVPRTVCLYDLDYDYVLLEMDVLKSSLGFNAVLNLFNAL